MSLNMYLGAADRQTSSMNQICIDTIQAMEDVIRSITHFIFAINLNGEAYKTAKAYVTQTFLPLAQGIIYLCEELIRQNDAYPDQFRSQVSTTDVNEQEIREQIDQIDRLIKQLMDSDTPYVHQFVAPYQMVKRTLELKLENLYKYEATTSRNYDTARQFIQTILQGLAQVEGAKGFDPQTRIFSTAGMDFGWVDELDDIHYTRKAKALYGKHLEDYPEDLEKIKTIIKFEDRNKKYVDDTNEFLKPLAEKDAIEIKYLMYTADEPYRTIVLKYLGRIKIKSLEGNRSFFDSKDNTITYVVEKDRTNPRGKYSTIFHELAHAIDYNYGIDAGMNGFFSDHFKTDGKTLAKYMHIDVANRIEMEITNELNKQKYVNIDGQTKTKMINNIKDSLIYDGPSNLELTNQELEIRQTVKNKISYELLPDEHYNASDVYGGVTLNRIIGKWGHHELSYWIDEKTGKRIREPNREGFASYFATLMIQDGDLKERQITSLSEYLAESKKHMDEILKIIGEGDKN